MLKGFIERRVSPRMPIKTDLSIRFERDGRVLTKGVGTDISAGGLQFYVPMGSLVVKNGEVAEFIFNLPALGEVKVRGEIVHSRYGIDPDLKRVIYYGAKFLDITPETWNYLVDYCRVKEEESQAQAKPVPAAAWVAQSERKDYRVPVTIEAVLQLEDGRTLVGKVEDLSYGGLRMSLDVLLELNSRLRVTLSHGGKEIVLAGVCIWRVPLGTGRIGYMTGLRFSGIDREQFGALRALIFELAK